MYRVARQTNVNFDDLRDRAWFGVIQRSHRWQRRRYNVTKPALRHYQRMPQDYLRQYRWFIRRWG